jgi:hypothetical protein
MHHWQVGGTINVGWPDFGVAEKSYTIVECQLLGRVFRARVTDGQKQGGFLLSMIARTRCWSSWRSWPPPH